jgi:hypothetical protein
MSSKAAQAWAQKHVRQTPKGFVCEYPKVYFYPAKAGSGTEVDIDKPMDADAGPLFVAELYYEFRKEVERRGSRLTPQSHDLRAPAD